MRALLAWIVLAAAAGLALCLDGPPEALDAAAPEGRFSAGRAFEHVKRIAARPHAVRSAANAEVRDLLVGRLRHLGFQVTVERRASRLGWPVENILAKQAGAASTGTVAVVCHYDSVPVAPGAGDDAAAVAAALETARVLATAEPLRNDLWILITDGEEAGLLGARAFLEHDPQAAEIDVVLNFEARGTSGRSLMFQTSPGNRALVAAYAAACPRPASSSLMVEFYRRLPNDTDFSVFLRHGIAGMNFAFIDGYQRYHTPEDTPDNLDLASLQHHGDAMLGLVRELGDRDLEALPHDEDAVYFDVLGRAFVQYPTDWAWGFTVGAVLMLLIALVVANRRGLLSRAGLAWSALAVFRCMVYSAVVIGAGGYLALELLGGSSRGPVRGSDGDALVFLGLTLLSLATTNAVIGSATQRHGSGSAAAGGLVWYAFLLILTNVAMVGASFVSLFPLLLLLAAFCASTRVRPEGIAITLALLYAVPFVLLLAPIADLLYLGMGLERSVLHAPLLGLWMASLAPFLDRTGGGWRRPVVVVPAIGGLALFILGL